jgi:hypothetical protein
LQQPRAALVVRRWNPADAKIHRSSTLTEAAYAKELIIPFGPFFVKFCSYFPYNAKLCINGNEYLKRQLAKRGVAFEALDNGVKSCANQLSADKIDRLLRKWLRRLPHPFPARDRAAGYRYQLSILDDGRFQIDPLEPLAFKARVVQFDLRGCCWHVAVVAMEPFASVGVAHGPAEGV